jgi:hypothetical protein
MGSPLNYTQVIQSFLEAEDMIPAWILQIHGKLAKPTA